MTYGRHIIIRLSLVPIANKQNVIIIGLDDVFVAVCSFSMTFAWTDEKNWKRGPWVGAFGVVVTLPRTQDGPPFPREVT